MAIYLDENMMGDDPEVIGFPHLVLCMAVVCRTRDKLYGIHFADPENAKKVRPEFVKWLKTRDVVRNTIRTIYATANMVVRYGGSTEERESQRNEELRALASDLGYTRMIGFFDGSIIVPRNGFYAEFRANHHWDTCQLFYKRDEKMLYAHTVTDAAPMVTRVSTPNDKVAVKDIATWTTGADGKHGIFHSGDLHEADFATRLIWI